MWAKQVAGLTGAVALAVSAVGCQNDAELNSSSRGASSRTTMTTVENAYLVPAYIPGACAIQYGNAAKMRFTATNNRDAEPERLLSITTGAADTVRLSPKQGWEIPPNASITTGQPTGPGGVDSPPLEASVEGLEASVRPATSVDVRFEFEKAGPIVLQTPVEACPTQSESMR